MMLSVMVMNTGAVFTDQKDVDEKHTEAVDMCVALSILNGYTDGSFKPNGEITRAEFCKMICVALNGGKEPAVATSATPIFSDVTPNTGVKWAQGYVEYCYAQGIVAGVGDGKFNPDGKVTATEAAKMLLVAIGYDADQEGFVGSNWAINVNVKASQKHFYDALEDIDTSAALTREHAAEMIWNALEAAEIQYNFSMDGSKVTAIDRTRFVNGTERAFTLVWDKYAVTTVEGDLVQFDYDSKDADWMYTLDTLDDASSATDYTGLLGQHVKMVYKYDDTAKKDVVYGLFAEESSVLFTGLFGDLPNLANDDTSVTFDGTKYKFESGVTVGGAGTTTAVPVYTFQNGCDITGLAPTNLGAMAGKTGAANNRPGDWYYFKAVDNDNNGKIDFFVSTPYEVVEIVYVGGTEFRAQDKTGAITAYKFDDVNAYDGMARGDFAVFTDEDVALDETHTFVKADLVSGKISVSDAPTVTIDGTEYNTAFGYEADANANTRLNTQLTNVATVNGYLFMGDFSNHFDVSDYAVIDSITASATNGLNGAQAKLLFSDGSKQVVDLAEDYAAAAVAAYNDGDDNKAAAGDLVTFDVNSDDEYELIYRDPTTSGFDLSSTASQLKDKDGKVAVAGTVSNKCAYIDNFTIANDAIVFVKYGTAPNFKYKVISGADLKGMNLSFDGTVGNALTVDFVLGTNSSNGVGDVDMAYITTGAASVSSNDTIYGYVTGIVQTQNNQGKDCYQYTLWTSDGEAKLCTKDQSNQFDGVSNGTPNDVAVKKGAVIAYTLNSDGNIDSILQTKSVDDITGWNNTSAVIGNSVAITGFQGDYVFVCDGNVAHNGAARANTAYLAVAAGTDSYAAKLADDCQFVYIDNNDGSGVENGTMSSANKMTVEAGTAGSGYTSYANYYDTVINAGAAAKPVDVFVQNAYLVWNDANTEIECVVFDMNNDIMK